MKMIIKIQDNVSTIVLEAETDFERIAIEAMDKSDVHLSVRADYDKQFGTNHKIEMTAITK